MVLETFDSCRDKVGQSFNVQLGAFTCYGMVLDDYTHPYVRFRKVAGRAEERFDLREQDFKAHKVWQK